MGNMFSSAVPQPQADTTPETKCADEPEVPMQGAGPNAPGASSSKKKANKRPEILDLVFIMDCTASMGSYINAAKQNIETIAGRLAKENVDARFGIVGYRDHPPQERTWISKSFPFTRSIQNVQKTLASLNAKGGGDGPEAVEAGLKAALEMPWRQDAAQVCILIADAPPHGLGEDGDGFPNGAPTNIDPLVVLDQMATKGISVYAVGCQPALSNYRFAIDFMIAVAAKTNGQAVALGSASSLSDVILGGAIEETDLNALMTNLEQEVKEMKAKTPGLSEDVYKHRVHANWTSRGVKTRQLKCGKLEGAYANIVQDSSNLKIAKNKLAALPVSKSKYRKRYAATTLKSTSLGSSAVELAEEPISMEQMSRIYSKCRKKGIF